VAARHGFSGGRKVRAPEDNVTGNFRPVYVMYTEDFRQKLADPPGFVAEEPQRRVVSQLRRLRDEVKRGNLYVEQGRIGDER